MSKKETYQDRSTYYHDKPCKDGVPSSNNRNIYTAYSKYLAPDTTDHEKLIQEYNKCIRNYLPLKIDRLPDDKHPPYSKDEVVGAVSLGMLNANELQASHWNFCNLEYTPEKLTFRSIYTAFKEFRKIDKEVKEQKLEGSDARNYMWQNERTDAYSLGFWLAPYDQYYVNKFYDKKVTLFQLLSFYLNFIVTYYKGNKSVRLMLWLQCEDMNHWLLKYVPRDKWVRDYFDDDHPFVKNL
jgi:hypothetical protein